MTIKTFLAKGGTKFDYNPAPEGEIFITERESGCTIVLPFVDLLEFAAQAAGTPDQGSDAETDELMRILERCGVFDPAQPRDVSRERLRARLKGRR